MCSIARICGFCASVFPVPKVDNGYVVRKLKVLLFPLMNKNWNRLLSEDEVKDDVSDFIAAVHVQD